MIVAFNFLRNSVVQGAHAKSSPGKGVWSEIEVRLWSIIIIVSYQDDETDAGLGILS
jgi:hypothetical protein